MAITAEEINNISFSNDFRGYNVDEVDDFLEHLATEVDALNAQIADLQAQLADALEQADAPMEAAPTSIIAPVEPEPVAAPVVMDDDEKDARIAELESQLAATKADGSVIAEALIVAQRAADEIVAKAKATAAETQADAEDEAQRIVNKATAEKQRIIEAIADLQVEREQARTSYQAMLTDIIDDCSKRLSGLGTSRAAAVTAANPVVAEAAPAAAPAAAKPGRLDTETFAATYTTPQMNYGSVIPTAPKPSQPRKDFSGYGDAADDFEFEDMD